MGKAPSRKPSGCASKYWSWRRASSRRSRCSTASARRPDRKSAAETLLRRIVLLHPNTLWATNELTLALFGKGAVAEAEIHARNAVRIAPENPQSHNLMGMIMTEANRPQIGEYHYRKVLELTRTRDPILLANLAWNLKNQGRMEEARQLYEESSAPRPMYCRPGSAGRGWRRPTAISSAPPNCSTAPSGWCPATPASCCRAPCSAAAPGLFAGAGDPRRDGAAGRRAAGSAPTSCWRKGACSTGWAAMTRPSRRSPKASGCAAR